MRTKMKKMTLNFITKLFIVSTLILFLGFGCGGSGGGDNSSKNENITSTSSENEKIEAALSATLNILNKGQKEQKLSEINDQIPFMPKMGKRSAQASFDDSCFTITTNSTGAQMTFDGSAGCGGMSGSISMTASSDGKKMTFTYHDVDVLGDGCKINGNVNMTFSESGSYSDITVTYENLDVCGETISSTIYGSYNSSTGEYVITMDGESVTINLDRGAISGSIITDIAFDDGGYADGSVDVTIDGKTYTCAINDVIIDPECDIPTSGTINVTTGSDTIVVDFSSTDCENKTVTYTYNGEEFTYNIDVDVEIEP